MSHHKSNDYKETVIQYYLVEDKTQEEVCKIFKCSPRSLMRCVNQYKKEGNVNKHYRKTIVYKVNLYHGFASLKVVTFTNFKQSKNILNYFVILSFDTMGS